MLGVSPGEAAPAAPSQDTAISSELLKSLCVFLLAVLSLPCCALQLRRAGAPACGLLTALAFPAVARGLQGPGASAASFLLLGPRRQPQGLWCPGLVAAAPCGIFPGQGSNPCARHCQAGS